MHRKLFCCVILTVLVKIAQCSRQLSERQKRALLLFPPTTPTRIQWIVGVGIPLTELLYEAETTGYVLKAEYFLPERVERLRTKTKLRIEGRNMQNVPLFERHLGSEWDLKINNTRSNKNFIKHTKKVYSSYRWSVYQALEGLATRIGLSGRACVLKSICDAAQLPLDFQSGLFGELLHILLTPSSSSDTLSEHADNEYFHAEKLGQSGAQCNHVFKDCKKSLLDHFSEVETVTEDVIKLLG